MSVENTPFEQFMQSPSAYLPKLVKTTLTVATTITSIKHVEAFSTATEEEDEQYATDVLLPSIRKLSRHKEFPILAVLVRDGEPVIPDKSAGQSIDIKPGESLRIFDGHCRIRAARKLEAESLLPVYWKFILLHTNVLKLPPASREILKWWHTPPAKLTRNKCPLALLDVMIAAAVDLQRLSALPMIPLVLDDIPFCSQKRRGKPSLRHNILSILKYPSVVAALDNSGLLSSSRALWRADPEATIAFLCNLCDFRLIDVAVTIIKASAQLDEALFAQLGRWFTPDDLKTGCSPAGTLGQISKLGEVHGATFLPAIPMETFKRILLKVADTHNVPVILYQPVVLQRVQLKEKESLGSYLLSYRTVAAALGLCLVGYSAMHTILKPVDKEEPTFPSPDGDHFCGIITAHLGPENIDKKAEMEAHLIPARVHNLALKWSTFVTEKTTAHRAVKSLSIVIEDDDLYPLKNSPQARSVVAGLICRLLQTCGDWHKLALIMGLREGDELACCHKIDPPVCFPALGGGSLPDRTRGTTSNSSPRAAKRHSPYPIARNDSDRRVGVHRQHPERFNPPTTGAPLEGGSDTEGGRTPPASSEIVFTPNSAFPTAHHLGVVGGSDFTSTGTSPTSAVYGVNPVSEDECGLSATPSGENYQMPSFTCVNPALLSSAAHPAFSSMNMDSLTPFSFNQAIPGALQMYSTSSIASDLNGDTHISTLVPHPHPVQWPVPYPHTDLSMNAAQTSMFTNFDDSTASSEDGPLFPPELLPYLNDFVSLDNASGCNVTIPSGDTSTITEPVQALLPPMISAAGSTDITPTSASTQGMPGELAPSLGLYASVDSSHALPTSSPQVYCAPSSRSPSLSTGVDNDTILSFGDPALTNDSPSGHVGPTDVPYPTSLAITHGIINEKRAEEIGLPLSPLGKLVSSFASLSTDDQQIFEHVDLRTLIEAYSSSIPVGKDVNPNTLTLPEQGCEPEETSWALAESAAGMDYDYDCGGGVSIKYDKGDE